VIEALDIVIPALNEQDSIAEAIADVHDALAIDHHVVVVDDGSSDSTLALASRLASRDPRLTVRSHLRNRGMGAAMRTGIRASSSPYVTMLPADRQIRATALIPLIELAGPRTVVTSTYLNRPNDAIRTLTSRSFRVLIRTLLGPTPPLEGTYIVPRDLLDEIDLESETFTLAFEILCRARDLGYAFRTVPIESHLRETGTSKVFNPRRIARVLAEVVKLSYRLRT
jgi:glycosyltransferase involved in cell wall biosynthesis